MTDEGRIRLTIIGGFLGSGKTTWLRHQLFSGNFGNAQIIVNEAAGTPVDDALLETGRDVITLAGGCVCCNGINPFLSCLLEICDRRSATPDPDERTSQIVLETSGLAEPFNIIAAIKAHPVLCRQIVVSEVIVIVDALNAPALLGEHALSRSQIEAADRLVLTRTDAVTLGDMSRLHKTLLGLAPTALISAASFGSPVPMPEVIAGAERLTLSSLPNAGVADIKPVQLDLGDAPDWTALTLWLSALLHARGDKIVRAKGVVQTPAGRLLVQSVRRLVQSPEILPAQDTRVVTDNVIVLIGSDLTEDNIAASFAKLTG